MAKPRETLSPSDVRALETLRKVSKPILTEEFAARTNVLVGKMKNTTSLATLFAPWDQYISYRTRDMDYPVPPEDWEKFIESLTDMEREKLCALINRAMWRLGSETIGDLREFSKLEGQYLGIGLRGQAFLKIAFRKSK